MAVGSLFTLFVVPVFYSFIAHEVKHTANEVPANVYPHAIAVGAE
jgi:hypothetical protein